MASTPADGAPSDDAQPAPDAQPAGDAQPEPRPVPSEDELERRAVDVRIRRRPRYGVFITLGMLAAAVAAFVWATQVPQASHVNWGSTVWVTTLGALGFGALLGAGVAVFADWLSRRK